MTCSFNFFDKLKNGEDIEVKILKPKKTPNAFFRGENIIKAWGNFLK